VLWLTAAVPALAQCPDGGTPVSPFVVGETWTAANSRYRVVSEVFVVGLTIESNVTVQVCGNYGLGWPGSSRSKQLPMPRTVSRRRADIPVCQ